MDWTQIINWILGGTSLAGVIGMIIYAKENKKLKQNEVSVSDVETQKQQMGLVELYKDKVIELLDQLSKKQDNGNANQSRILLKLDRLEDTVGDIVTYLDGPFDKWRSEQEKRKEGA